MIIEGIDIVALIGREGAARLLEGFGGLRVYFARSGKHNSIIARKVGASNADKLAQFLGSDDISVPLGREFLVEYYISNGMNYRQIARELRITEGGVLKIARRVAKRKTQ